MPELTVGGHRLDYHWIAATDPAAPTLVFLHEGLGSLGLWRDFPARVAAATGGGTLIYSRYGYGRSDVLREPRRPDYLHVEALEVLPELLGLLDITNPLLIGHSDGASIALIHAGAGRPARGLILEAPHVFVEEITLAGIRATVETWKTTDLPRRLARHHADADRTFRGWADIWLSPAFRDWNIEGCLRGVTCPVLVIQGADDEYGTAAQVEAIARQVSGPAEQVMVPQCGHTPHRDQEDTVFAAMVDFIRRQADRQADLPPPGTGR